MQPQPLLCRQAADGRIEDRPLQAGVRGVLLYARRISSDNGSMAIVIGSARLAATLMPSSKDGAMRDDPEPIERRQPLGVSGDVACVPAGHSDRPLVRHRGAGHEVDEHLGGTRVQPGERQSIRRENHELRNPQRAKRLIRLHDAAQLDERRTAHAVPAPPRSCARATRAAYAASSRPTTPRHSARPLFGP